MSSSRAVLCSSLGYLFLALLFQCNMCRVDAQQYFAPGGYYPAPYFNYPVMPQPQPRDYGPLMPLMPWFYHQPAPLLPASRPINQQFVPQPKKITIDKSSKGSVKSPQVVSFHNGDVIDYEYIYDSLPDDLEREIVVVKANLNSTAAPQRPESTTSKYNFFNRPTTSTTPASITTSTPRSKFNFFNRPTESASPSTSTTTPRSKFNFFNRPSASVFPANVTTTTAKSVTTKRPFLNGPFGRYTTTTTAGTPSQMSRTTTAPVFRLPSLYKPSSGEDSDEDDEDNEIDYSEDEETTSTTTKSWFFG